MLCGLQVKKSHYFMKHAIRSGHLLNRTLAKAGESEDGAAAQALFLLPLKWKASAPARVLVRRTN